MGISILMSNLILTSTVLKAKKKIATLLPFEVSQVSSLQLSRLSSQLCLVVVITMADTGYNKTLQIYKTKDRASRTPQTVDEVKRSGSLSSSCSTSGTRRDN
jgi:hypothetical protein